MYKTIIEINSYILSSSCYVPTKLLLFSTEFEKELRTLIRKSVPLRNKETHLLLCLYHLMADIRDEFSIQWIKSQEGNL